jgi:hypothetical protein
MRLFSLVLVGAPVLGACQGALKDDDPVSRAASDLAVREALLARREAGLSSREALLAVREDALLRREKAMAQRERPTSTGSSLAPHQAFADGQAARAAALKELLERGLDERDADSSFSEQLGRGDELLKSGEVDAAVLAFHVARALARGTEVTEDRVRRAYDRAHHRLQAAPAQDAKQRQAHEDLRRARGLLADGEPREALRLIKQVEGPPNHP